MNKNMYIKSSHIKEINIYNFNYRYIQAKRIYIMYIKVTNYSWASRYYGHFNNTDGN